MEHSPPSFFRQGPAPLARLSFFVLLSVIILVFDARFKSLEVLRQGIATALYPLVRIANVPGDVASRISDFFVSQGRLQSENTTLKNQNLQNAQDALQLKQLLAENAHLRDLMHAQTRMQATSIMAEIDYDMRDAFSRKVVINRGSRQGIELGRPVIDDLGVIGQVTRVYPLAAEVTLLTDKEQAIPVQVVRNGLRAVLYGSGDGATLDLRFMAANADVQNDDVLVTSGIDGTYLPGLPVAKVVKVEREAAYAFAKISCVPAAGIDRNTQVLVLSTPPKVPAPIEEKPVQEKPKGKRARK